MLRIDNGDLGAIWPQWCIFSDHLVIYYSNLEIMHIKLKLSMSAIEWYHLYYV